MSDEKQEGVKATAGPWRFWCEDLRGGKYWVVSTGGRDNEGHPFDTIDIHDDENGEANARLISAAPDLLAACRALLPEGWGDDDTMDHMPGVKLARAAISKATEG